MVRDKSKLLMLAKEGSKRGKSVNLAVGG